MNDDLQIHFTGKFQKLISLGLGDPQLSIPLSDFCSNLTGVLQVSCDLTDNYLIHCTGISSDQPRLSIASVDCFNNRGRNFDYSYLELRGFALTWVYVKLIEAQKDCNRDIKVSFDDANKYYPVIFRDYLESKFLPFTYRQHVSIQKLLVSARLLSLETKGGLKEFLFDNNQETFCNFASRLSKKFNVNHQLILHRLLDEKRKIAFEEASENAIQFKSRTVISLDGGGIKGAVHCRYLRNIIRPLLENEGINLLKDVDVLVGVSTGAIASAYLALYPTLESIDLLEEKYFELGVNVFGDKPKSNFQKVITALFGFPFYSQKKLRRALVEIFGEKKMKHCDKRLLVAAVNIQSFQTVIFDSESKNDRDNLLVDVLMASSAAPFYFPAYSFTTSDGNSSFVDGGLSSNNPSLIGIKKIMEKEPRVTLDWIRLISVGTGDIRAFQTADQFNRWYPVNALAKFPKVIEAAMHTNSDQSANVCNWAISNEFNVRLEPNSKGKGVALDDLKSVQDFLIHLCNGQDVKVARRKIASWYKFDNYKQNNLYSLK
ncbi:MAG: patatin-like phospholipase family protein [Verrucomicrobiales bacterium]|nr:patatin-like phospholipase family protein [Verrucomicrobiales bacterium]